MNVSDEKPARRKKNYTRVYWEDDAKVQKYAAGKGKYRAAWVRWMGRDWVDLRLLKRNIDGYEPSRNGVRLTVKQMRELLPILVEMLDHIDSQQEEEARETGDESQ